jgi:hypothetical protein
MGVPPVLPQPNYYLAALALQEEKTRFGPSRPFLLSFFHQWRLLHFLTRALLKYSHLIEISICSITIVENLMIDKKEWLGLVLRLCGAIVLLYGVGLTRYFCWQIMTGAAKGSEPFLGVLRGFWESAYKLKFQFFTFPALMTKNRSRSSIRYGGMLLQAMGQKK